MPFFKTAAILALIILMLTGFAFAHDEVSYNFQTEQQSDQQLQLRGPSVIYTTAPAPVVQAPEIQITHSEPQEQTERGLLFRLIARFLPGRA